MSIRAFPISRNKVIIPKLRPEVLHRGRLLYLFGDLLDKKLILVTAPAGYGKTTLLIDFASQTGLPVCWLSLDTLDKDPQRFVTYLIAAISERFPKFGNLSTAFLKSVTDLEQDSERLLVTLTNEIHDRIDEHFALVIDDYHLVDPIPAIRTLLSRFIFLAGENCHIILLSRRLPALSDIALMVARQQVAGFDFEQLAFQPEEIRLLLEKTQGVIPGAQVVEDLMRQTEGWVTGLLLFNFGADVTLHSPLGINRRSSLYHAARSVGVNLAAYFEQQILAPQPVDVREFLLQSSLLNEFDVNLCNAVLGAGHWKELIETALHGNLFITQVGPKGEWVRYHPLFQEFLQERIQHEEPEAARAILDRLANVHEENGEWEKAHAIYLQLANASLLAGLLERAGSALLLNERLITLNGWLEELPARLLQQKPSLLSLKGALLCSKGEGKLALNLLDQAISDLNKTGDHHELALAYIRRSAAFRLVGDNGQSLKNAEEALRLSKGKRNMAVIYAEAELFKGISLNGLGRIQNAIKVFQDALGRYEQLEEPQSVARVQMCLGSAYQNTNNDPAAREVYGLAYAEWKREANFAQQAGALNSIGMLYHREGDYKMAVQSFEEGLECARRVASSWREALLLTSLGDVYLDLDEFDSAGQAFSQALDISKRISYRFLTTSLYLSQARLARYLGRAQEAHMQLSKARASLGTSDSNSLGGQYHLEHGCMSLLEEKPAAARSDFLLALDEFQTGYRQFDADRCRIWLAAAFLADDDPDSACPLLKEVMQNSQMENNDAFLIHDVRRAFPWLSSFTYDGEAGRYLSAWHKIIMAYERRLPVLRKQLRQVLTSIPIQAPHLAIKGFGKIQVRINGRLVNPAEWKTNSVKELFFFLLSRQKPVTKEEIGEILWQEISPEQLKLRFKNNLYRLRCALGQDAILFEDDQYSFNRMLDFEYDVEEFADQLFKARVSSSRDEKIARLQAAIALRQGPYLINIDSTWVLAEREQLEQSYLKALAQLAELLYQAGRLDEALQACQQALKIDSCREEIHRQAMEIYASQGNRLGVIWQYQACLKTLKAELNVSVSEETEALFHRLMAE